MENRKRIASLQGQRERERECKGRANARDKKRRKKERLICCVSAAAAPAATNEPAAALPLPEKITRDNYTHKSKC